MDLSPCFKKRKPFCIALLNYVVYQNTVFNPIPCANVIRVKDTHCLTSVNVDIPIGSCIHPIHIFIPIT